MGLTAHLLGLLENHFLLQNEPSPLHPPGAHPLPLPQPARAGGPLHP